MAVTRRTLELTDASCIMLYRWRPLSISVDGQESSTAAFGAHMRWRQ